MNNDLKNFQINKLVNIELGILHYSKFVNQYSVLKKNYRTEVKQ